MCWLAVWSDDSGCPYKYNKVVLEHALQRACRVGLHNLCLTKCAFARWDAKARVSASAHTGARASKQRRSANSAEVHTARRCTQRGGARC
eukprot:4780249-Pleurochrysis_carterae.AAC.3